MLRYADELYLAWKRADDSVYVDSSITNMVYNMIYEHQLHVTREIWGWIFWAALFMEHSIAFSIYIYIYIVWSLSLHNVLAVLWTSKSETLVWKIQDTID